MSDREFDVAIAGGGPAGAAAALTLARAGMRVLLAEAGEGNGFRIGEGLPPSARLLLAELGALEQVIADGHRASHGTLAFWGSDQAHPNDFLFQLHGTGLQLDRQRFDASLRQLAGESGARCAHASTLKLLGSAEAGSPHPLRLHSPEGDKDLSARWLLDATGRSAQFARACGARRRRHDHLIAFHLRLSNSHASDCDGRTWVEAVDDGWWYSVLLPSGERLVACLVDADLVDKRTLLSVPGFSAQLTKATHLHDLCTEHGWTPASRPQGADAGSCELESAAGHRWLAIGDAALAFDPLSSKGISNALYTGLAGAKAILAAEQGDADAPARYAGHVAEIHRVYRQQLSTFYAMEQRWPQAPFWRRRQLACAKRPLSEEPSLPGKNRVEALIS